VVFSQTPGKNPDCVESVRDKTLTHFGSGVIGLSYLPTPDV